MKKLAILAVLMTVFQAQAQNTAQAWQFRVDICELIAKQSALAYQHRVQKLVYDTSRLPETPDRVIKLWAINYGQVEAVSATDAVKVSYAKCMDNVDRVFRDARSGRTTRMDQLQ